MLSTIRNIFEKEIHTCEKDEEPFVPKLPENPYFLTDENQIAKLLSEIVEQAPLCSVVPENMRTEFNTSILTLDPDEKIIVLDALMPTHGNQLLAKTQTVKLSTFAHGINLSFQLNDIALNNVQGEVFCTASYPSKIFYPQRRRSLRVKLSTAKLPFSGVASRNGASVGGLVSDISHSGIGFNLSSSGARIQRGDILKNCYLMIDDYRLDFDLLVRFVKRKSVRQLEMSIGGTFEKLSGKGQKKLAHFMTRLERREIRKLKAY